MNFNINNSISYKGKCEACSHQGICKYSEEFKKVTDIAAEIKIEFISPVCVDVSCNKYEKINEKQDGFYFK